MTIEGIDFGFAAVEVGEETRQKQAVNTMGDGTLYARNTHVTYCDYTFTLRRLSTNQKNAMAVLIDFWDWASTPLAIVDDDSNAFTGHYWGGKLKFRRRSGPFWTTTLTFRRYL